MKNGKVSNFTIQMTEKLELPKDVMLGAVLLHLTGQSEVEIENFKGIVSFTSEQIVLTVKNGKLEINGKKLDIKYYSIDELKITGRIQNINYIN
ncbi:MAG: YabP/YqfC family sporulation protein [Eubacterium sp.]|nr:YabP/YqfC family sporulation protein [Eubacterium sp.]